MIVEGAKAAAKSAGDKAGSKLVEKAFTAKKQPKTETVETMSKVKTSPTAKTKTTTNKKTSEDLLKDIYGDSILGKGIVKVTSNKSKY